MSIFKFSTIALIASVANVNYLNCATMQAVEPTRELSETTRNIMFSLTTETGCVELCKEIRAGEAKSIYAFSKVCVEDPEGTESQIKKVLADQVRKFLLVFHATAQQSALVAISKFEAFSEPATPPALQEVELSPFIAITACDSVLPPWLKKTLTSLRFSLGKDVFVSSQSSLLDVLKVQQKATIDDPSLRSETAFMVKALPVIQSINSELHVFLSSMRAKTKGDTKSDVGKANLVEVEARIGLVYSLFDAIFGNVDTQATALFIMHNTGAIKDIDHKEFIGVSASNGLDINSHFMESLRAETKTLLSYITYLSGLLSSVYTQYNQSQKVCISSFPRLDLARKDLSSRLEQALEDEFCLVDTPENPLPAAAALADGKAIPAFEPDVDTPNS